MRSAALSVTSGALVSSFLPVYLVGAVIDAGLKSLFVLAVLVSGTSAETGQSTGRVSHGRYMPFPRGRTGRLRQRDSNAPDRTG